jgi:hypothetical protein
MVNRIGITVLSATSFDASNASALILFFISFYSPQSYEELQLQTGTIVGFRRTNIVCESPHHILSEVWLNQLGYQGEDL